VNGDGKPDIAIATRLDNTVGIQLGNGDGTFQAEQKITTGTRNTSVAIADLNGDGIPDLVVTNQYSDTVSVLLGNGNGTLQPRKTFAAGYGPRCLHLR